MLVKIIVSVGTETVLPPPVAMNGVEVVVGDAEAG
jgi:hypothetical protein